MINRDMLQRSILVTGASGQLGQLVLEELIQAGAKRVIATTRHPDRLSAFKKKGVEVRMADFEDAVSLAKAFKGAERILLISTDAIGRRLAQHQAAINAAVKAGAGYIAYTSFVHGPTSSITFAPEHMGTEDAVQSSGLEWTLLRNNFYMDMLPQKLAPAVASGILAALPGNGAVGYVSRLDCARAAAAALISSRWDNKAVDITGPAAVSYSDLAAMASDIFGRRVSYQPLSEEALRQGMGQAQLPEPVIDMLISFEKAIANGELKTVSNDVETMTGKPPRDAASFLRENMQVVLKGNKEA